MSQLHTNCFPLEISFASLLLFHFSAFAWLYLLCKVYIFNFYDSILCAVYECQHFTLIIISEDDSFTIQKLS